MFIDSTYHWLIVSQELHMFQVAACKVEVSSNIF